MRSRHDVSPFCVIESILKCCPRWKVYILILGNSSLKFNEAEKITIENGKFLKCLSHKFPAKLLSQHLLVYSHQDFNFNTYSKIKNKYILSTFLYNSVRKSKWHSFSLIVFSNCLMIIVILRILLHSAHCPFPQHSLLTQNVERINYHPLHSYKLPL